jgi:hypothetical protein
LETEIENKKGHIITLQQRLSALEKDIKRNEELLKRCQLHYKEIKVKNSIIAFGFPTYISELTVQFCHSSSQIF